MRTSPKRKIALQCQLFTVDWSILIGNLYKSCSSFKNIMIVMIAWCHIELDADLGQFPVLVAALLLSFENLAHYSLRWWLEGNFFKKTVWNVLIERARERLKYVVKMMGLNTRHHGLMIVNLFSSSGTIISGSQMGKCSLFPSG